MVYFTFSNRDEIVINENNKPPTILIAIPLFIIIATIIYNPKDFFQNYKQYLIGQIMFFIMFYLMFVVHYFYAYANMHDVSWGNRPDHEKD